MTVAMVTGGHGFAGTALRALLASEGWDVVSVGRSDRAGNGYLRADVTDLDTVTGILDTVRPDVVFHLAASTPQQQPDVSIVVADAVGGTQALCTGLRRTGLRSRVVLAGSSAQYGAVPPQENPVTEETLGRPVNAYGYAKAAAEAAACALAVDGSFEVVPARAFNHLGPGEPQTTVASAFARRVAAVRAGVAERVRAADLDAVRDFTDVRDIARGYLALANRGVPGRVYNLCSGRPTRIGEILDGLLAAAGLDHGVVDIVPGGTGGIRYQVGSPARVAAETGWRAEIPLATSLADLLASQQTGQKGTVHAG